MEKRVGSFREVRRARLPGFRLVFKGYSKTWGGGVADIEPSKEGVVYGVVYNISKRQLEELDRYEGYPNVYKRAQVKIITEEEEEVLPAITYVKAREEPYSMPSKRYVETIIRGLKAHGYQDEILKIVVQGMKLGIM
jgi:gamma-glutamylcyclotransferase (GGCT)/AIG2-like uncharacterized protein YtfP